MLDSIPFRFPLLDSGDDLYKSYISPLSEEQYDRTSDEDLLLNNLLFYKWEF